MILFPFEDERKDILHESTSISVYEIIVLIQNVLRFIVHRWTSWQVLHNIW
jgi:hypothetical protein